jgi:hypothetical protein
MSWVSLRLGLWVFSVLKMSIFRSVTYLVVGRVAQSVRRLATGWTVWGSTPGGGEMFGTCPDRPCGPPSLLYNGYRVLPRVESGRGWRWSLPPSSAEV